MNASPFLFGKGRGILKGYSILLSHVLKFEVLHFRLRL